VALLIAAEPTEFYDFAARAGLDACAQLVATARCVVADVVGRAERDPRPFQQRLVALLELHLAAADLARAQARLRRLRRRATNP
jgi:hypothetical protein